MVKRALWTTFSFLIIAVFIAFLRYLLTPLWPSLSDFLLKISENIKSSINLKINPYVISLIIFVAFFITVYTILTIITSVVRKKTKMIWDEIDSNVRYKSTPFTLIKLLLIILFVPFIYAYGKTFIMLFDEFNFRNKNLLFFCIGFIIFLIIWIPFWKKFKFISIFEHEFTHLFLALCFFHRPKAFHVDEHEGGWVKLAGVNFIVTLGPYFFLTFCFLVLPLYLVLKPEFYPYFFLLLGVLASYHTLSTIRETKFNKQPDIIFNGKIFSLVVIVMGNVFCYGFLLAFVLGGFLRGQNFILDGWTSFTGLFQLI